MIKLENISKYYYSANSVVPALRKIRLEFKVGEFVVITGESGSGKSTLLNIISGLDTYDEGELFINEEATSHFDDSDWDEYRKNKIGYVFQNYNLIDNYSALYNVESALLIQGYDNKEARRKAKELLNRVGLKKQINQRASRLSSGQRQRLSIARALAKDTDIIVADEPTGNLDPVTGRQIMELFAELSKDKLVIIVTHNYEETMPYVTRKVRLHDGEIASDIYVEDTVTGQLGEKSELKDKNLGQNKGTTSSKNSSDNLSEDKKSGGKKSNYKSDLRIAWRFTRMNIETQPRRVLLFLCFFIVTSIISFLFLGEIYSNMDDIKTKDYSTDAFLNSDNTRIVVKRPDGGAITDEDIKAFQGIKYVKMTDRYDYANDINYYINAGEDYDYSYETRNITNNSKQKIVNFLQSSKFMKSATCISNDDLSIGRIPTNRNEVVLYSEDQSTLGKEQSCYFTNRNMWNNENYYSATLKVVGLLKKESDQVFFSNQLCSMLSVNMYNSSYHIQLAKNASSKEFEMELNFIPVIGENLKDGELRVSQVLAGSSVYHMTGEAKVTCDLDVNNSQVEYSGYVQKEFNDDSFKFVEMSEAWFNRMCNFKSCQASLYIKDYINTDYVLKQLKSLGYQAISSYRIGSAEYNIWKVEQRNTELIKSFLVLIFLCMFEIILVGAFLKMKYKNYIVLISMGMNRIKLMLINYLEMIIYSVISIIFTILSANALSLIYTDYPANRVKYYDLKNYIIYIILNLFIIIITVGIFNRYLKRRQKWS